ncbi:MAG: multicopper oxidase [Verrucomicrobia subdivision 3 bacterium]|nr:multicopper oxidase [Limisphaerales bacterium]
MKTTRRQFISTVGVAGAAFLVPGPIYVRKASAQDSIGILDPTAIPKYVTPLIIPPAMPRLSPGSDISGRTIDQYAIAVRQFQQQILPPGFSPTTVWSYGAAHRRETFNYPAFTIEAEHDKPVRITWINDLVDSRGQYLPHLLPVDQTVHWANPPGGVSGRDEHGFDPTPYRGPVPIVTHLHGAHTTDESDGFAEAWYLPRARNIPRDYARTGTWYNTFREKFRERHHGYWAPGTATFHYPNDQAAATLWYHDHVLGMTRLNVYAGPAGFYLLRGGPNDLSPGVLPGPAPALGDGGPRYHEIPIAIQDRSFNADSSLFYPDNRAFFEGLEQAQFQVPFIPDPACDGRPSDISPIWNPEFFGNTMVVNGRTWPLLKVEPRRYRFRLLNGCNSRFLILKLVTGDPTTRPGIPALPFWQIGAEGGFLSAPVQLASLLMSPAERADVIVDFTGLPTGTEVFLTNEAPDEPFGGGIAGTDFPWADPDTTGQVMKFLVGDLKSSDTSVPPETLTLPTPARLGMTSTTRRLSLNEESSKTVRVVMDPDGTVRMACDDPAAEFFAPTEAELGTVSDDGTIVRLGWDHPITENPELGATEVWELFNFTEDAHPIHIHEVQFEVVNRQPFEGTARPPEPWETGRKDTVIAYPGEITRVKAHFDLPGLFVWHCHIVEHEDNEMMRPYSVGPIPTPNS